MADEHEPKARIDAETTQGQVTPEGRARMEALQRHVADRDNDDTPREPMTDERLAAIRFLVETAPDTTALDTEDALFAEKARAAILTLLAEEEWLHGRVWALKGENKNLQELCDATLFTAADTVKRVKAENAAMHSIVEAMVTRGWYKRMMIDTGKIFCVECRYEFWSEDEEAHAADCPITKARTLLANDK